VRWTEADGTPARKLPASLIREGTERLEDAWAFSLEGDGEGVTEWLLPEGGTYGLYLWRRKLYRRFVVEDGASVNVALQLPPTAAPSGGATLHGTIKSPDGARASGLAFLIEMSGSPWTAIGETDGGGDFKVSGLPDGNGRIRVPFSWWRSRPPHEALDQAIRVFPGLDNHLEVQLRAR